MQEEYNWQDLYNLSPAYFFSFSYSGEILVMNQIMLDDLGYELDEVIQKKKFIDILTVGGKVFYQTHFFPLVKLHGEYKEVFLSFLSRTGEEIPILLNVKMQGNGPDAQIHCGGIRISKRNKFEREILEAKKAAEKAQAENENLVSLQKEFEKNQLILQKRLQRVNAQNLEQIQINSIMSHDMLEPVRKISVFSKLLLEEAGALLTKRANDHLQKIYRSSDSMKEMMLSIQKFLALHEKTVHPEIISLDDCILEAREKAEIEFEGVKVNFDFDHLPQISGDKIIMARVFYELLSNSFKFSDNKKSGLIIKVTADKLKHNIFTEVEGRYRYEDFNRIVFEDNGIGFSNKFDQEIFSLFRKAHVFEEGLGFGLAYCKKAIELHHGYISASGEVGKGSKFTLLLPDLNNRFE